MVIGGKLTHISLETDRGVNHGDIYRSMQTDGGVIRSHLLVFKEEAITPLAHGCGRYCNGLALSVALGSDAPTVKFKVHLSYPPITKIPPHPA